MDIEVAVKGRDTSLDRAFAILELLDSSLRGWNISEISRKLGIPKSTTHVLVLNLERLGYVTRDAATRSYTLGLRLYGLGRGLMRNLALPEMALPHMERLVERVRLTAHLAVLDRDQAIYVAKVDGPGLIRFDTYVGKRTNVHCTAVGKVLLAYLRRSLLRDFLARHTFAHHTAKTITAAGDLLKELERVREKGYAFDDEEEELEVRCVAVPVFNQLHEPAAALGVTGTAGQVRPDNAETLAALLKRAAAGIFDQAPFRKETKDLEPS